MVSLYGQKHAAVYGNKSAVYIPAQYAGIKFYPFQQSIVDMIQQFDSRIIDVIVDISGNNGKSTLASLCELMHGCIDMPLINDYKETVSLCVIFVWIQIIENQKVYFF